ncbi:DeoR/GlpR family DNA-binding transcription regulator [Albidovulum sediminicola]|uniref:DeoR/GlpR family DNA-binding transcription regulator n=1 Tax=Albidovulum sediminicola TaxID=2984331 RepID=A0ABT2Z1R7_9RHOB|nr:DeoR/GlpR family DNA-binding transcription regulator [Defluviimonas sp. WL0075]MCV2865084.1 DeoR/GlpR family DNA-binding transcription regulator [Defluviimonas sp. WL0075]
MKLEDRRKEIIDLLIEQGTVGLDDLAVRFGVSKMTIHRDLDDLESAGLLRKVRGGASIETSLQFESDYRYRARRDTDAKRRIARAAVDLAEPGMTVLINDGTTAGLLAERLAEKRPLTVITNNLAAIEALTEAPGITLLALGGTYSRKFNGFFGVVTEEALAHLRADLAFLSSPAISGGVCYHMDQEVMRSKRMMIESASRAVLLADRQKFGRTALYRLTDLGRFDTVITDAALPPDHATPLVESGVRILIAKDEE